MAIVVTPKAELVPRRPASLDGKRRLLNGPGGASASYNACASPSLATNEALASGAEDDAQELRRKMYRLWERSAVQPYEAQYYC